MSLALLYLRTIKFLKISQILARISFIISKPKPDLSPPPEKRVHQKIEFKGFNNSLKSKNTFEFLNQRITHKLDELWTRSSISKLWLYNLHYFDYLNSTKEQAQDLLHQILNNWIKNNPPGVGIGWDPYPLSLRIVNLIKWDLRNKCLNEKEMTSLAHQIRYLLNRIEYHIEGNHLIANAKALIFSGFYFGGEESDIWLKRGLCILEDEIKKQILSDGGHYERSVMYHAIVLEDLLDIEKMLLNTNRNLIKDSSIKNLIRDTIDKMIVWLDVMSHPDGEFSFFNDCAMNVARNIEHLKNYASELNHNIDLLHQDFIHLEESGYIRVNYGAATLILDIAPIGPDFIPAHAHADTLSYELSIYNQRLIVNSGTSNYENNGQRKFERSTAAHSTVEINQEDSSEVWHSFRVARRAYPELISINFYENYIKVVASHDGYDRLIKKPKHTRSWSIGKNFVNIKDNVSGVVDSIISRHYLHPKIIYDDRQRLLIWDNKKIKVNANNGYFSLMDSEWFKEFGHRESNKCITINPELSKSETSCHLELSW